MVGSFACSSFAFSFPFLVKFDFVWEIQQAVTVGVWDNVRSSLSFVVWLSQGNVVSPSIQSSAVL